jgi:hypothetical protein
MQQPLKQLLANLGIQSLLPLDRRRLLDSGIVRNIMLSTLIEVSEIESLQGVADRRD